MFAATGILLAVMYLAALAGFGLVQQPRSADLAVVLGNTVGPEMKAKGKLAEELAPKYRNEMLKEA